MINQELKEANIDEKIAMFVGIIILLILLILVFDLGVFIGKKL